MGYTMRHHVARPVSGIARLLQPRTTLPHGGAGLLNTFGHNESQIVAWR